MGKSPLFRLSIISIFFWGIVFPLIAVCVFSILDKEVFAYKLMRRGTVQLCSKLANKDFGKLHFGIFPDIICPNKPRFQAEWIGEVNSTAEDFLWAIDSAYGTVDAREFRDVVFKSRLTGKERNSRNYVVIIWEIVNHRRVATFLSVKFPDAEESPFTFFACKAEDGKWYLSNHDVD